MQNNNNSEQVANTSRSPEFNKQQQSTTNSIPRNIYNPRFAVTPETLGMNLNTNTPTTFNRQQSQPEPPLVEVKSYYERHNKLPLVGTLADLKQESNNSFHSSQTNTTKNSYASIKTETIGQRSSNYASSNKAEYTTQQSNSPNVSPKSSSQQWNFDSTIKMEPHEHQHNIYTSTALLCPAIGKNFSGSNNLQTSHPSVTTNNDASRSQCAYGQNDMPQMSFYEEQWLKSRSGSDVCVGDAAKLNFKELNDIFLKRIEHIDADVGGDKDLKIITYQEWIEMLTKVSESFITNMDELEREVAERLKLVQSKVSSNCRHSQGNELMKCRKDIETLLKYIQNARNYNRWDLQGMQFETITPAQVLDMGDYDHLTIEAHGGDAVKNCNEADVMQRNKLFANMKALAHEVAEKHDEVRELKRQVICLEDEIQKAQKKIQLKDDVIKELRNDLKCANNKISDNGLVMPPINFENQTSRSANTQITDCNTPTYHDDNGSQFDSLSHTELEEQQKLKILEEEINEYFEMNTELNKQKMENQRKKLMDIFQILKSEKAAAYRKLDYIRRQLIDLEADSVVEGNMDSDSGFHSKNENDNDVKILDAVRKRLRKLNETNVELKKKLQKLELDNSELANNLQTEKSFFQRNSETLKEVADLLSSMTGKQFSYTDIYNKTQSTVNPFCETIMDMKNEFQERESQLLKTVGIRNKELENLSQSLFENEKLYNEERATHWDINKTPTCNTKSTTLIQTVTISTTGTSSLSAPPPAAKQTTLTGQHLEDNHTKTSSQQGFLKK